MIISDTGKTWLTKIQPVAMPENTLRRRAIAYAAGTVKTVVRAAVSSAITKLFLAELIRPRFSIMSM